MKNKLGYPDWLKERLSVIDAGFYVPTDLPWKDEHESAVVTDNEQKKLYAIGLQITKEEAVIVESLEKLRVSLVKLLDDKGPNFNLSERQFRRVFRFNVLLPEKLRELSSMRRQAFNFFWESVYEKFPNVNKEAEDFCNHRLVSGWKIMGLFRR